MTTTIQESMHRQLQMASAEGHKDVVQILLDRGADVNAQDSNYDGTALQAASAGGHKDVVQILLDRGADINAPSIYYGTALQAASAEGHKDVVQILINRGVDVIAPTAKMTSVPGMQRKTAKTVKKERETYSDAPPENIPPYSTRIKFSGQQKPLRTNPVSEVGIGSKDSPARVKPIASMNQVKEYLKDPEAHVDWLRYHESVIVDASNILSGSKVEDKGQCKILELSESSAPRSSLEIASECQQVLKTTMQGFQHLQNQDIAGECFNILVRDYQRSQVVNVVPISLGVLECLETNVSAMVEIFSSSTSGEDDRSSECSMRLNHTVDSIWSYLGLNIGSTVLPWPKNTGALVRVLYIDLFLSYGRTRFNFLLKYSASLSILSKLK